PAAPWPPRGPPPRPAPAGEGPLKTRVAYYSACAAAPVEPARAAELAAVVQDDALRGLAWEQVGRSWLQRDDWDHAFSAVQAATGIGRVFLFGEMVRRANSARLDQLALLATTDELRAPLVEGLARKNPEAAWQHARELRGTPFFFTAAIHTAAAFARADPARALEVLAAAADSAPAAELMS